MSKTGTFQEMEKQQQQQQNPHCVVTVDKRQAYAIKCEYQSSNSPGKPGITS